ncbi:hypothetical protein ACIBEJ_10310 [Nonomuraea sp. NPDC050790]|uniref:hypothetical protein n=1 Tax=Nonomuraea sp. NPDC050790 TaxID=3364371 RepID=UPI003792C3DF
MAESKRSLQDFNIDELAKSTTVDELTGRVVNLEKKLDTSEQISKLICSALDESHALRTKVSEVIIQLLSDYQNRKALKQVIDQVDRDHFTTFLKRGGYYALTALIALGAAYLGAKFGR